MHGPASLGWLLVALCAATGAYCLLRMRSADEGQRRAAGGEAVMGFGMAAMAVPAGVFTPPGWAWPVYLTVFGAAAVHALWAARGSAHHLHHLVGALAMVYMAAVMALSPSHVHAHGSSGVPLLTGVLLLYFAAYVLASGARLVPVTSGGASGGGSGTGGGDSSGAGDGGSAGRPGWADRPELARACRLSMGIGMLAMLITM